VVVVLALREVALWGLLRLRRSWSWCCLGVVVSCCAWCVGVLSVWVRGVLSWRARAAVVMPAGVGVMSGGLLSRCRRGVCVV